MVAALTDQVSINGTGPPLGSDKTAADEAISGCCSQTGRRRTGFFRSTALGLAAARQGLAKRKPMSS